jgi:phosphate starvation-inducible PhoH-like protein
MFVPKTVGQLRYLDKLNTSIKPILVVHGPSGTGKTTLACQKAAELMTTGNSDLKVVLTRPAVSVEEDMGYLPGDINSKFGPWSTIMTDVFEEYMTRSRMYKLINSGQLSILPLGYMRGKTFKNSFVIADEMQNSTRNQMRMLMTRVGEGSRLVVTGDVEQSDLVGTTNGLYDVVTRMNLHGTDNFKYIDYTCMLRGDICRHPLVDEVLTKLYTPDSIVTENAI